MQATTLSGPFVAEQLGQYGAHASFADLPGRVIDAAKRAILDSLACAVGGSQVSWGQTVLEQIRGQGGSAESTVIAAGCRRPASLAAYANAFLANLLDFDDTYGGAGHPGCTVIPAALAIGEQQCRSGKDLITAVVLGYDVALRILEAIDPSPDRSILVRGQGTWQVFGAVAAASRLYRLDAERFADALALAVLHAPVPSMRRFGHESRPLSPLKNNAGWACMGGITAAQLAGLGLPANRTIFDGETGFWIMASSDRWRREAITNGLGSEFMIERLSYKPYPACRYIGSTLDAVSALVTAHDLRPEDVRTLTVRSTSKIRDFADYQPRGVVDAQFSIPHTVAMVLLRRPIGAAWQSDTSRADPDVRALGGRVHFETDPAADAIYRDTLRVVSTVRIECTDGRVLEETVGTARGDPSRPLSDAELAAKFTGLVEPVLGADRARRLLDRVHSLEHVESVSELGELLGG